MNAKELTKIIQWFLSNKDGVSSQGICSYMLGLDCYWGTQPPSDKGDRARCIKLLKLVPEFYRRINEMREINKEWDEQITLIQKEIK